MAESRTGGNERINDCPSAMELSRLARGDVPFETVELLFDHISSCQRCETKLERLTDSNLFLSLQEVVRKEATRKLPSDTDLSIDETIDTSRRHRSSPSLQPPLNAGDQHLSETRLYPQKIGRYQILSMVAQGGFGRVYKAFDGMLNRNVAIKVPRPDRFSTVEQRDEFLREAQTIAALDHRNIVPVYDADITPEGMVFIVMKWVEGKDLRIGKPDELKLVDQLRLMEKVCEAVQFAHDQGILHRDLKPANILVDVDGEPLISDFGLAIRCSKDAIQPDGMAGTISYMSPEQLLGKSDQIGHRCDVWSLGVILYELVSGNRPFGDNDTEIVSKIIEKDPLPVHLEDNVNELVQRTIGETLKKDPELRTPSARSLGEKINSIRLKAEGVPVPFLGFTSRRTAISLSTVALLIMLIGIFSMMFWLPKSPGNEANELAKEWGLSKIEFPEKSNFHIEDEKLYLTADGATLLGLGETQAADFDLRVNLGQVVWDGNIGFFWGLRDDHFQTLVVKNALGKLKLSRQMRYFLDTPGQRGRTTAAFSVDLMNFSHLDEWEIILQVRNNQVQDVFVNGMILPELAKMPVDKMFPEKIYLCNGKFGFFGSNGSGHFRKHQLVTFNEDP